VIGFDGELRYMLRVLFWVLALLAQVNERGKLTRYLEGSH
jgi:hypothetical protein